MPYSFNLKASSVSLTARTTDRDALLNCWERLTGEKMSNQFEIADLTTGNGDLVEQSSPEIMKLALEYANLAALAKLSEPQADRLEEILEKADDNKVLNFWITEVDHFLAHYLGLLDEDDRESYRDQQALLREYAGAEISLAPEAKMSCATLNYNPDNEPIPYG
jgi:hypothetical protein